MYHRYDFFMLNISKIPQALQLGGVPPFYDGELGSYSLFSLKIKVLEFHEKTFQFNIQKTLFNVFIAIYAIFNDLAPCACLSVCGISL